MLTLLRADHGCILFYLMRTMTRRAGVRVQGDMTTERLQALVARVTEQMPDFVDRSRDPEDKLKLGLLRYINEWKTALWVLRQNYKGIAVETAHVWEHFRSRYAFGPHGPKTHRLLLLGQDRQGRRNWMTRFRACFDIRYRKLCVRPPVSEDERCRKAPGCNESTSPCFHRHIERV